MKHTFLLSSLLFLSACGGGVSENVKYQANRDNIIDVKDKVKIIDFKDVFIGRRANAHIVDNYLV
ncbi:MAG: 6-bladed beta-propeller, partial [Bacteroidales bacterium]|nr:6-bladed beta-propeller [Bacteroidales bacterium]